MNVGPYIILAICVGLVAGIDPGKQPEQIHLSLGEDVSKMIITWSTKNHTDTIVMYGVSSNKLNQLQKGQSTLFVDGGIGHFSQYIHRADLDKLHPNTTYYYIVGSNDGISSVYSFKTLPAGQNWFPKLVVIGDLGSANAQSLPRLENDTNAGMYNALIHVGDFAYNLEYNNGTLGDTFMNQIQPIATRIPYMTCVGNHEPAYNFSHYKSRFNMPGDNRRMYYSFNMGPVHFIAISTEFLYFAGLGYKQIFDHYDWLKNDLKEASAPENRTLRPWIITFGHRPMYCSNNDNDDCTSHESLVRVGVPLLNIGSMEDLLYEAGVDLAIWAHEHSFERLWPVYNLEVMNGSYSQPYKNPGATTHVITGSAGCSELVEYFEKHPPAWSAFRSSDYGYTRLNIINTTHLYMEQVSDNKNGTVIDSFTLIREQHGPFKNMKKKK